MAGREQLLREKKMRKAEKNNKSMYIDLYQTRLPRGVLLITLTVYEFLGRWIEKTEKLKFLPSALWSKNNMLDSNFVSQI